MRFQFDIDSSRGRILVMIENELVKRGILKNIPPIEIVRDGME
jgi:hypothetical protein